MNADALNIAPYNSLAALESCTSSKRGCNLRATIRAHGGTRGTRGATEAWHPKYRRHGGMKGRPLLPGEDHAAAAGAPLGPGGRYLHALQGHAPARWPHPSVPRQAPKPPENHRVRQGRQLAPGACPLLPLAMGRAMMAAHQGVVGNMDIAPRWLATCGGYPTQRPGAPPHHSELVPHPRN